MEKCNYCGAEKVRNPKTGKMFCKDKCWLKNEQTQQNPQPPKQDGWTIITDEIANINRRLDKASELFTTLSQRVDKLEGK